MLPPSLGTISPPAWVLLPSQLEYYHYPSSFSTTTTLPASVLLLFQLQYYYYPSSFSTTTPPSFLNSSSEGGIGHALVSEHSFCWAKSLLCITWFKTWWCRHLKSMLPPQILRLSRGVSRGWWRQNTRPAFTCNLQGRSAAHFWKRYLRSYIIVYTDSLILPR